MAICKHAYSYIYIYIYSEGWVNECEAEISVSCICHAPQNPLHSRGRFKDLHNIKSKASRDNDFHVESVKGNFLQRLKAKTQKQMTYRTIISKKENIQSRQPKPNFL